MASQRRGSSDKGAGGKTVWDSRLRKAGGSLFERLVADQEDLPPPSDLDPLDARVRSIKRHLRNLLNTRSGGAASAPEFGITDFNDSTTESQDMARYIAQSIRKCIDDFEPRVDVASVVHVPNPERPLNLEFKIQTTMLIDNKKQNVQIDLVMEEGKNTKIL